MTSKQSPRRTAASKPATAHISPHWMRRHRDQLDDWLHANGIDPSVVSVDHAIRAEGDTITYWAFDLDDAGKRPAGEAGATAEAAERTGRCTRPAPWLTPSYTETG